MKNEILFSPQSSPIVNDRYPDRQNLYEEELRPKKHIKKGKKDRNSREIDQTALAHSTSSNPIPAWAKQILFAFPSPVTANNATASFFSYNITTSGHIISPDC